jgi:hypothetical protein
LRRCATHARGISVELGGLSGLPKKTCRNLHSKKKEVNMADWISTPESSHVSAIKYEPENQEVFVQFNDGDEYKYSGVPENVWQEFLDHPSKGRYVNIVLARRYRFEKQL